MSIHTLKVRARLGLGFGLVLALLLAMTALGLHEMAQSHARLEQIVQVANLQSKLALEMRSTLSARLISLRNLALTNEAAVVQAETAQLRQQAEKYAATEAQLLKLFARHGAAAAEQAAMGKIKRQEQAALPLLDKAASLALALKTDEAARVLMRDLEPVQVAWRAALVELLAIVEQRNAASADAATADHEHNRAVLLGLGALALFIGVAAALAISRSLLAQLGGEPAYAAEIAGKIAAGDLGTAIALRDGDRASLLFAMAAMRDSLARIVGQVRSGTDTIATSSGQIAAGNADLSSRTEQQAASLQQTAASMEQLTGTVKQNADHAHSANGLAASASRVAVEGGAIVAEVMRTMSSINSASGRIADIIGVIDGIAFQTNILALNAAVEAARAGAQGRGFAVVASEVRNLAQRSAAAAREIKTLIAHSVETANSGAELADQASNKMDEIVSSVASVTGIMQAISTASREQAEGIEQVNQAIRRMDRVTLQNAALVEQAAGAAGELRGQAGHLAQLVQVFQLDGARADTRLTLLPA